MYQTYKDRAAFYIVYIREAHPSDGWQVRSNERAGVIFKQPATLLERQEVAGKCLDDLELSIPCLLDDMKDTANKAYAGWPDRLYVIDIEGKVAYKGAPGPRGFNPREAEAALVALLPAEPEDGAEGDTGKKP